MQPSHHIKGYQVKPEPKDKYITIRVDAETHEKFHEQSESWGGVSAVIRAWIEASLAADEEPK